jgi:STE24 endopeptidase
MTSSRSQTWATAAVLIAVAAAWVWGVHALWTSVELPSLDLPQLDPHTYFSDSFLDRSATYGRFMSVLWLLGTATLIAVLVVYARNGERLARESAAGRVGTGLLLAMLGFAIVWLAEVPFDLAALWWQRRYDVSHQGYVTHLVNGFLGLGSQFVFVCLGFAILMGLAGVLRHWWWLAAVPCFVALALVSSFVSPYLIPDTSPIETPSLKAEAQALERIEGAPDARLRVQNVHRFTTAPNAESTGLGPTRTVVLWDTLLNDFSPAEIRLVLAHEIGHLAHDDPLRRIGWIALFLVPALGLVALFTRRRGGLEWPEAVPLALLILVVTQLVAGPLLNAAFRREEAAADWAALEATREPQTDRALMHKLATKSLADPEPPSWAYGLFEDHPTIMQRIALARAWEERH